jgi:SNF2 family DNA or RNA helicase
LTESDDDDDDDLANLLGGLAVDENSRAPSTGDEAASREKPLGSSAKIRQLLQILEPIRERGERTIVFSQFTSFLDLLGPFLKSNGISFVRCKSFISRNQIYLSPLITQMTDP